MSKAGPEMTVNEYLTKVRDDSGPGIVRSLFEENIKFEFWGQCIYELKENMFFGSKNEDPHEHISNITDIIDLFHSSPGTRNFKQESNEPLHLAWERFNDLLYNCPEHKINVHEQLQIFYQGLDTETRQNVDFKGLIPRMTRAVGIEAIIDYQNIHSLALKQMPKYTKFMKDLLTQRGRGNEASKITLNERCSIVVLNKIPLKEKDPGSFTIPCVIGQSGINKALADLGASISLMTYLRFPPSDDDTCHSVDIIDLSILDHVQEILPSKPFNSILFKPINNPLSTKINSLWDDNKGEHDLTNQISRDLEPESKDYTKPTLFATNMFEGEKPTTKLKDLPSHLEYAFLDNNQEFPLLDVGLIYDISDSPWVSPIYVVPKKGGITVVKLNDAIRKDHFPLLFIDQMLERLSGNEYYCFLDRFLRYFQIPLAPEDQEKTTFTCPYKTFAYRRMPFGLCNAPTTFQRCMTAIFHDMCKDFMEVFMDDFYVFGNSFDSCFNNLSKMLARCEETNLVLNRDKCHFMVKEGIVLGHKISKAGIEVDKAKDAKPRLIRWVLRLQEFTIEIKDKKGSKNLAADHLSRLENLKLEELDEDDIRDSFPDEHLMVINIKEAETDPWYADYANFLVSKIVPQHLTYHLRKKFLSGVKKYIWDNPNLFKSCPNGIIRWCIFGKELHEILEHCHTGPTGGHYRADITARKVFEVGFYWPTIFKDSVMYVRECDACQKVGNISARNQMPLTNILVSEVFDMWGIDFMGPFLSS
ncbi:reverse transcriptase domain-containing protein [Tanacetum coccineum]